MKWNQLAAGGLCAAMLAIPVSAAPAEQADSLTVNGSMVDLSQAPQSMYEKEDGTVMVPLWLTAEALGYTVTWQPDQGGARVENEEVAMDLVFGVDSYCRYSKTAIGMTAPQHYSWGPEVIQGRTYVPAEMFSLLFCDVQTEGGTVSITSSAQLPNPMVEYDYLFEAEYAVGFPVLVPASMNGVEMDHVYVIDGDMVQVNYADGTCYRAAQGAEDISGDYSQYEQTRQLTSQRFSITARGAQELVSSAWWTDGSLCFSAQFAQPVSQQALLELVDSLTQMN